jgi:hypothetical protein
MTEELQLADGGEAKIREFWTGFGGSMLVIPYFVWFANVTRHQNQLVALAGNLPRVPQTAAA